MAKIIRFAPAIITECKHCGYCHLEIKKQNIFRTIFFGLEDSLYYTCSVLEYSDTGENVPIPETGVLDDCPLEEYIKQS